MMFKHYSDYKSEWHWENFTPKELSCKCCGEYWHDPYSLDLLQKTRNLLGRPLSPTSAHRCRSHNSSVGGKLKSQHLKIAFDLPIPSGMDRADFLIILASSGWTTYGMYASFVHVDRRSYKKWYGCKKEIWGNAYNKAMAELHDNSLE
jgi:hypothetical protein